MIQSLEAFIRYFDRIRQRTITFFRTIPPEQIDWCPQAGEFTCGDIVRHLAASELMFVAVAVAGRWDYPGHEREHAPNLESALVHLEAAHTEAMRTLRTLSDADLDQPRPTLAASKPLKVWHILMLMAEHEIHHRSQLATYLTLMGVEAPQIYGMKLEEVVALTG
jgi:uncharacterized damage-inducible protein DinB